MGGGGKWIMVVSMGVTNRLIGLWVWQVDIMVVGVISGQYG